MLILSCVRVLVSFLAYLAILVNSHIDNLFKLTIKNRTRSVQNLVYFLKVFEIEHKKTRFFPLKNNLTVKKQVK